MILLIDNYDSFTYNLYQVLSAEGAEVEVRRNDVLTPGEVRELNPSGIVISPGPGDPAQAGISVEVIRSSTRPVLGVCLGHQCIGAAFGGTVDRAQTLMHGKTSQITHDGRGVFSGLPDPLRVVRYHSLTVQPDLPGCLEVTARAEDGTVMGVRHRERPIEGVQFHPESILTEAGAHLLRNFAVSCGEVPHTADDPPLHSR